MLAIWGFSTFAVESLGVGGICRGNPFILKLRAACFSMSISLEHQAWVQQFPPLNVLGASWCLCLPLGRRTCGDEWRKIRNALEILWCWQGSLTAGAWEVPGNFKNKFYLYIYILMKLFSSLGCSDFLVFLPGVDCSRNELATCFTLRRGISYITVATHFFSVEVKWISFSFKEKKEID